MATSHVCRFVSFLTLAGFAVACGGSNPGSDGAKSAASATGAPGDSVGSRSPQDAGPTTTTTLTLGDAGELQGAKLTSNSTSTVVTTEIDGGPGHGPHVSEPGRSAKDIQAIIVSHRDEARECYDRGLKAHPGVEGDLDVEWTIDPKGAVTEISVDTSRSQILEPGITRCVIGVIQKIHFNESAKGFDTHAHYPFNFHPRSGGVMVVRDGGSP